MKKKVDATAEIRIKASPEEKAAWQAAAKRDERNLSDWLRYVGHRAAGTKDPRFT